MDAKSKCSHGGAPRKRTRAAFGDVGNEIGGRSPGLAGFKRARRRFQQGGSVGNVATQGHTWPVGLATDQSKVGVGGGKDSGAPTSWGLGSRPPIACLSVPHAVSYNSGGPPRPPQLDAENACPSISTKSFPGHAGVRALAFNQPRPTSSPSPTGRELAQQFQLVGIKPPATHTSCDSTGCSRAIASAGAGTNNGNADDDDDDDLDMGSDECGAAPRSFVLVRVRMQNGASFTVDATATDTVSLVCKAAAQVSCLSYAVLNSLSHTDIWQFHGGRGRRQRVVVAGKQVTPETRLLDMLAKVAPSQRTVHVLMMS